MCVCKSIFHFVLYPHYCYTCFNLIYCLVMLINAIVITVLNCIVFLLHYHSPQDPIIWGSTAQRTGDRIVHILIYQEKHQYCRTALQLYVNGAITNGAVSFIMQFEISSYPHVFLVLNDLIMFSIPHISRGKLPTDFWKGSSEIVC